jgi:flagellar motor switch/type III secretory pathway protein FliN
MVRELHLRRWGRAFARACQANVGQRTGTMDAAVQLAKETPASPDVAEVSGKSLKNFGWLPCQLSLEIPVVAFTVGDLLRLGKDSIVETACPSANDIPLRVNGELVAWAEFEVTGSRLAVRITELA